MSRLPRDAYLMEVAKLTAQRSTCLRLQVGAILASDGRIIATGYNGAPARMRHCEPETCGPDFPCDNTVHAEANCIYFAAKHGIPTFGTTMYATDSPCMKCAQAIINAGIVCVYYLREYRDRAPIFMLHSAGVQTVFYGKLDADAS